MAVSAILAQAIVAQDSRCGKVFCLRCLSLPHGASRMDAKSRFQQDGPRSSGVARPPSVQWPSARQEVPKRSQSAVSKQAVPAAAFIEGGPIEVEDHEVRGCVEGVGAGTVGSPHEFGGSSQEGQDGGFNRVSRHHQSPTRGVSCRSKCENISFQGSLAALGPDDIAEWRVLEDALAKVRARAIVAPVGQRLDECEKFFERAAKRVEKAQEAVAEALKVQSWQREEGVGGGGSVVWKFSEPKSHVAQLEGDLRQSHRLATEKISAETSLKQLVELLMQEVAALKVRVRSPASGSGATEMALVQVARSGSALMSDLIEEADKKRPE